MKMPQKINTISDLKKINFGQSVPEESLHLLYWFANKVNIDNKNNNYVIWLNFDPDSYDFGSHLYHNNERLLKPLPLGQKYYTIGNVAQNEDGSQKLPDYVVKWMDNPRKNMARVIIRVRKERGGTTVHQVYITQHYGIFHHRDTRYDPEHTYHVTSKLLRQIRNLSVGNSRSLTEVRNVFGSNIDDSQLRDIRTKSGDLDSLGLLLSIVMPERYRYSNTSSLGSGSNTPLLGSGSSSPTNSFTLDSENSDASNNNCKRNVCIALGVCFLLIVIIIIGLLIGMRKK